MKRRCIGPEPHTAHVEGQPPTRCSLINANLDIRLAAIAATERKCTYNIPTTHIIFLNNTIQSLFILLSLQSHFPFLISISAKSGLSCHHFSRVKEKSFCLCVKLVGWIVKSNFSISSLASLPNSLFYHVKTVRSLWIEVGFQGQYQQMYNQEHLDAIGQMNN